MAKKTKQLVRLALIGCGGMARYHVHQILKQTDTTRITVVCDPSPDAYAAMGAVFKEAGHDVPPNVPNFDDLLTTYGKKLDAAFIITPHAYHFSQATRCLEAGLDVLLEKPMVMNAAEATSLIKTRDETKKLLVVAFQGSLSPQVRTAANMLHSGECGKLLNISATVWQDWRQITAHTWRQQPDIAGGGFLFDTGAHMMNTVSDLAGENFVEVAAWMDNRGRSVDILATVMGRLESGALVTMNACGDAIPGHTSEVWVSCTKALIRTGIWGERLDVQRRGRKQLRPVKLPDSLGVWEQFLAVRNDLMPNPSPPEIGLRMAHLWDTIKASAAQNGVPVRAG